MWVFVFHGYTHVGAGAGMGVGVHICQMRMGLTGMNTGARSGIVCLGVIGYLVCDRVGKHEPQADRPVRRVRAVWVWVWVC